MSGSVELAQADVLVKRLVGRDAAVVVSGSGKSRCVKVVRGAEVVMRSTTLEDLIHRLKEMDRSRAVSR